MACEIEGVSPEAFAGACLLSRWWRRTGQHPETWEGIVRAKWVTLAVQTKQYDFSELDPYQEAP